MMRRLALVAAILAGCARGGTPGTGGDDQPTPDAPAACVAASCDDQNMCTTDTCDPAKGCMHVATSCDDNDACTTDTCDPQVGCMHDRPHGSMTFNFNGAIQSFAIPTCVIAVHVKASGAEGGAAEGAVGGKGATLEGDFAATPGNMVSILVGARGADYNPNPPNVSSVSIYSQRGGTGGGGSFVVQGNTILVIAGGGGGASGRNGVGVGNGGPGQITTAGQASDPPDNIAAGANGTGGYPTSNPGGFQGGTGGGGYSGNGVGASDGSTTYGTADQPGTAFVNGGAGGVGGSQGRNGGFGGGGSAGYTGGGGGGYSGGAAGATTPTTHAGGGGGSINNGTNQTNTAGDHTGNGVVTISW